MLVTSNGSWCIGIKGEMSGTVCVTFTWDIYIYMSCLKLLFVLLFVHYCNVMVYMVYCVASGKQEKVQACLVTLWLFIISCHSLSKTTLGSLCSWKPAWSLKKRPHSMCFKPFVKMCIFVVTGLDTYFFPNLAVGQPSNNMDLSEIEICLRIIIIFAFWHL